MQEELWEGQVEFVSMLELNDSDAGPTGADYQKASRIFEIFLDYIAWKSVDPTKFLFHRNYTALLSPGEIDSRIQIIETIEKLSKEKHTRNSKVYKDLVQYALDRGAKANELKVEFYSRLEPPDTPDAVGL